ncbi:MAG: hypothetical protein Q9173_004167 [Seirophora scorigena]
MDAERFRNGTLGGPDLTDLVDLRLLCKRALEVQQEFKNALNSARSNTRNIVRYFDYCNPREVFAEYYRIVRPGTKQKIFLGAKASMIDHPLQDAEIQRHINRVYGIIRTLRLKNQKEPIDISGTAIRGRAGALREVPQEREQPINVRCKTTEPCPRITATNPAEQVSLQRLLGSCSAAALEPLAVGTAEGDKVAPGTTASGSGKTHIHLLSAAAPYEGWHRVRVTSGTSTAMLITKAVVAPGMDEYQQSKQSVDSIEDGWNLIEAEGKQGGRVVGEEGTKDFVHTEEKTIANEGANWDFCI